MGLESVVDRLHASDGELHGELMQNFGGILYSEGCISPKAAELTRSKDAKSCLGLMAATVVTRALRNEVAEQSERLDTVRKEHAEVQTAAASQAASLQQELFESRSAVAASEGKLASHQATVQRGSFELQKALQLAVAEFSSRVAAGDVHEPCDSKRSVNNEA